MTDDKKPKRPDPFAPLPLSEVLTGKTASKTDASKPQPTAPPPSPPPSFESAPPRSEPALPLVASSEPPRVEPVANELAPFESARVEPEPSIVVASEPPSVAESDPLFTPDPDTQQAWTAPPPAVYVEPPVEAALVPATYNEADLRDAVGATPVTEPKKKKKRAPTDDGGDGESKPKSRKAMLVAALSLFAGAGITAIVLLGRVNSARFVIACESDRVIVQQGRSFPPWGESEMGGAEWKALKIPPEAPCAMRETEDKTELAKWYGTMLENQATALLTAREVSKVDEAEVDLKQALLVARSLASEDDRLDARGRIERMLGDVAYWRASARLRTAADALADAAKQFDAAALQKPRYVTDAAAWATYVRQLVDDLKVGPDGVKAAAFPPMPPSERPTAPAGVALPVEPAGSSSAEPPPPTPDAGVPSGGVLL